MYSAFARLLAERGKTVADVSRATGIGESTLSNWKKRDGRLSTANLAKIATYFGVSTDYFLDVDAQRDAPSFDLTADEWAIIQGYRASSAERRDIILSLAREALLSQKSKLATSGNSTTRAKTA